jgi:ABC-2 type transport system permease protein
MFPAGSLPWLMAHEMRLAWRDVFSKRPGVRAVLFGVALIVLVLAVGLPLGMASRGREIPLEPVWQAIADLALLTVFTLMLSQCLAASTLALYGRGDLDLLFSAPISPRKVLFVRCLAIAANAYLGIPTFIAAVLIPVAIGGHPGWLGLLGVLAAAALLATSLGLLLAMSLFRILGPKRTRAVAQVLAALIGAAFFLAAQYRNITGSDQRSLFAALYAQATAPGFHLFPFADLPLRAMVGQPLPLAILMGGAAVLFAVTTLWLGGRFAADAAAASGVAAGGPAKAGRAVAGDFAQGIFANTVRKELKLLLRDIAMLSQILLRMLYLLPLGFVLARQASRHAELLLPAGAAALVMMAGQVALSLVWVTVSTEESPELLLSSPAPLSVLHRAKLTAALAPLAVILAGPLIYVTWLAPVTGVCAILGSAASALAAGLLAIWYQKPAKRADFRRQRRGGGGWLVSLAFLATSGFFALATFLAASPYPVWAIVPAVVGTGLLFAFRRSEERIIEVIRAG